MIPPSRVKNAGTAKVELGFSSIFWNTAWTRASRPHAGHPVRPEAPGPGGVPHRLPQQLAVVVSHHPRRGDDPGRPAAELRPTVQVIDDWFTARKLGLVFEAKVGGGKSAGVQHRSAKTDLEQNPVARQMLHSLLDYMASERFQPAVELTAEQVRGLAE